MRDLEEARYRLLHDAATLALSFLNERQRLMVIAYYWRYLNTNYVGDYIGISGQRVRQVMPGLHEKMRCGLVSCGVDKAILEVLRD